MIATLLDHLSFVVAFGLLVLWVAHLAGMFKR